MKLLLNEYEKLIQMGYQNPEIEQLLFLYRYMRKKDCINLYSEFLIQVKKKFNAKQLEQLIKCITHNTPYTLLLNSNYSVFVMNEIRRFLEDTLHEKGIQTLKDQYYYNLGKKMLEHNWDENMIYQLRRFVKGKKIASLKTIQMISKVSFRYKIKDWLILSIVYEKFSNENNKKFENWFLHDFSNWIKNYSKIEKEEEKNKIRVELLASLFR